MFLHLSVILFRGGSVSRSGRGCGFLPLGIHSPGNTPLGRPPRPRRWPLKRAVRILLECILVIHAWIETCFAAIVYKTYRQINNIKLLCKYKIKCEIHGTRAISTEDQVCVIHSTLGPTYDHNIARCEPAPVLTILFNTALNNFDAKEISFTECSLSPNGTQRSFVVWQFK